MAENIPAKSILTLVASMVLVINSFLVTSCSKTPSDDAPGKSEQNITPGGSADTTGMSAIRLSSENGNTVIGINSNLEIRVDLMTKSGQPVNGKTIINFELSDPTRGRITSPAIISEGSGTVNFISKDSEGIVTLTASNEKGDIKGTLDIQVSDVPPPATLDISADPPRISIRGTSHIIATVLDKNGNSVKDGTQVNFMVSKDAYGTVTESALTISGKASATFTAAETSGEVEITATSGSASETTQVTIASADVGSIEFVSAVPNIVGLKGAGQVEVSAVTFLVKNSQGTPVQDAQSVYIELFGPGGGEYLEEVGRETITVSTENGAARVNFHSGVIPGPVTLRATVTAAGGNKLSTSSGIISVGGGKPTESQFSLSASVLNLEGLAYDGIESKININLADRYGNVEVLEGTTVSFYTESGGISRSVAMNKTGSGSVTYRTQRPIPHKTLPEQSEIDFMDQLHSLFNIPMNYTDPNSPNPRDGLCTIIAVVDGEEEFTDRNANGQYDPNEPFIDSYSDIFIDMDDDNSIDEEFEDLVIDQNNNAVFDGENGRWDGNKKIYKAINLLITGEPSIHTDIHTQLSSVPNGIVTSKSSLVFHVFIGDRNFNIPIGGTSFSISTDKGKLSGTKSYIFGNTCSTAGGPIFSYVLSYENEKDPPSMAEVTMSLSWKGQTKSLSCAVPVGPASSGPVNIVSDDVGSIEFVSATPAAIGLKGLGQVEISTVTFLVKNNKGTFIQDPQDVSFELFGPGGGEYLEEGDPNINQGKTATVSSEGGMARVNVHSGIIPGTVTLKATVAMAGGTTLTAYSGTISIGGGKPSESHFSLSAVSPLTPPHPYVSGGPLNLPGLAFDNFISEIWVHLADRYGNVEVLEGTTVSFYSEAGGINRSAALDQSGSGVVTFRTQDPVPYKTLPKEYEITFMNRLNSLFGIPIDITDPESPNPRDGLCTIVAVVDGEEEFTDTNANGQFNPTEPFVDTYDDIFIDMDDDNIINTNFEDLLIDLNGDSAFDGINGRWDGNKKICKTIKLLLTGEPYIWTNLETNLWQIGGIVTPSNPLYFEVFIGDRNYNIPCGGTSYSISTDKGILAGSKSFVFSDTSSTAGGPIKAYSFSYADPNNVAPPDTATLNMSLSWQGMTKSESYTIPID
ncbi:MAG: Ig-like domain-containing protein [bacterium]